MLERITPRERKDLLIAWLAISISFALVTRDLWSNYTDIGIYFFVAFITAGIGFSLHEMAHKFTAMRFGFWAEFQKDTQMLLIAIIVAVLVRVVFAAPGATVIYGSNISREQNGKISIAGPLTNLALCVPFAVLFLVSSTGIVHETGKWGIAINAMIAFFNMIPVSVLDGRKILFWNKPIFIVLFLVTLGVLYISLTSIYLTEISL